MKCREFHNNLAEYVAGRLPVPLSIRMQAHCANCPACARAEGDERELRSRFESAPPVGPCPDLWPRLASQRLSAVPRRAIGRVWAFGGALAVAASMGFLWIHMGPAPAAESDLHGVVTKGPGPPQVPMDADLLRKINDMRQAPVADSTALLQRYQADHDQRSLLLGGTEEQ